MAKGTLISTTQQPPTLLIAVHAPYNTMEHIDSYFEEFLNLVRTDNIAYQDVMHIRLRSIDAAYFFTSGKLSDIKKRCEELSIQRIVISDQLTAVQERNLDEVLNCAVIDRTRLILDIFHQAATSAEGKIQVEIAILQFEKTRLAGKGVHYSQQEGVFGLRGGAGETAKEKERRHLEKTILTCKRELERIQQVRETQRKKRMNQPIPKICIIGYTNAGKSTLLNTLTKSDVLAEDKLFATLDTTTRELYINSKKVALISDTVGFIQQLPHNLIEAFKSTLSELTYADLLLHVVDCSDKNWESHIAVVHTILKELGVDKEIVYVFNKADKTDISPQHHSFNKYWPHVFTNARTKEGVVPLQEFIDEWAAGR